MVIVMSQLRPPGKDQKERWAPVSVWMLWGREKFLTPGGTRAPDGLSRRLVTMPTTLTGSLLV